MADVRKENDVPVWCPVSRFSSVCHFLSISSWRASCLGENHRLLHCERAEGERVGKLEWADRGRARAGPWHSGEIELDGDKRVRHSR